MYNNGDVNIYDGVVIYLKHSLQYNYEIVNWYQCKILKVISVLDKKILISVLLYTGVIISRLKLL